MTRKPRTGEPMQTAKAQNDIGSLGLQTFPQCAGADLIGAGFPPDSGEGRIRAQHPQSQIILRRPASGTHGRRSL